MRVIDHKEDGKYKFLSPIFIMKEFRGRGYAQQAMRLDLVKLLVKHKASTFFFRIDGVSMVDAAMDDGDIIIVDRAIEPLRWLYHILHLRQRESSDAPEW